MGGRISTLRTEVPDELAGERADRVVAVLAGVSRAEARRLVEAEAATIGGEPVEPRHRVAGGAVVEVALAAPEPALQPEEVPFEVRYEDDHVAVVDKPPGVVVHPGAGRATGTLAAGLLARWPELEGVGEPGRWGIVHRLDRETSGLLLVAKRADALSRLQQAIRDRHVGRTYLALVGGGFDIPTGTVDAPIGRDPRQPTRMAVRSDGRPARTHYTRLAEWDADGVALVEVRLETGRTHQVRVHLAAIGHPVIGDSAYGRRATPPVDPGRVWLHATRIAFQHPDTASDVSVQSPLPMDLAASLAALGDPSAGAVPA